MRKLTLGQLRNLASELKDDTIVLIPADDHTYRRAGLDVCKAIFYSDDSISEDFDDEEDGERRDVIVIY